MMTSKFISLLLVQSVYCFYWHFTPVVEVSEGKLIGLLGLSGQFEYYGIPYATSQRFQAPKPPQKWHGIFQATTLFDNCPQKLGPLEFTTEDCLKLDIYTPEHAVRGQRLPVAVFFHGGSFLYGAKWTYNPEYIVKKNVIVVVVNYRLGVLGFLCLNNIANLGLKDQVAALKWIQKNIAAFGGDPDNVTIFGESAGAASTSMHVLSKKSKGLFHKAIMMSGVALVPWAFNVDPLTSAYEDASKIKKISSESDIYNTFLKLPIKDLLRVTLGSPYDIRSFRYSPCGDSNLTDPFFHDSPYNIIKSGHFNKVPMIIGSTDLEGLLFYGLNSQNDLRNLEDHFVERLPSVFSWCSHKDKEIIAHKIRSHYFGNQKINSDASIKGAIDMYSDWIAYGSIDAFSNLMAKYSNKPVYNYLFTYEGGLNYGKYIFDRGFGLKGATHIDDLFYIFTPIGITLPMIDRDRVIIEKITTMFTDFMKYGDPTPSYSSIGIRWPRTVVNSSHVMRIDTPLSVIEAPDSVRGQFFLSLLCEYGLRGHVPCESAMQCNLHN